MSRPRMLHFTPLSYSQNRANLASRGVMRAALVTTIEIIGIIAQEQVIVVEILVRAVEKHQAPIVLAHANSITVGSLTFVCCTR
jgi:hypothetical protein